MLILFLNRTDIRFLNWASASLAFARTVRVLSLPTYKYYVLLGLIVSVGGLTESLVIRKIVEYFIVLNIILKSCNFGHGYVGSTFIRLPNQLFKRNRK